MKRFLCAFLLFGSTCLADHTETVTDPNTGTVTSSTYDDFDHLKIELVTYSSGDTHAWWRDTGETLDTYAAGGFEYTYANGDPSVYELLTKSGNTWTSYVELGDGTIIYLVNPSGEGDVQLTVISGGMTVYDRDFVSDTVMVDSVHVGVEWVDPIPLEDRPPDFDTETGNPPAIYLPPTPIGPNGPA